MSLHIPSQTGRVEPTEILGWFYTYNSTSNTFIMEDTLKYSEAIMINPVYRNEDRDEIELQIKLYDRYEELYLLLQSKKVIFVRNLNEPKPSGGRYKTINPIAIFDGGSASEVINDRGETEYEYILTFTDFKDIIFNKKEIQHNVFYENFNDFPVDTETNSKKTPDNFNKIDYHADFNYVIGNILLRNLIDPVEMTVSTTPGKDATRKITGLNWDSVNTGITTHIDYTETTRTLKEINDVLYPILESEGEARKLKYVFYLMCDNASNEEVELRVQVLPSSTIVLDNKNDTDKPNSAKAENKREEYYNLAFAQSSSETNHRDDGTFIWGVAKKVGVNDFSTYEVRNNSQGNEQTTIDQFAQSKLYEAKPKQTSAVEIILSEYKVMEDFLPGDIIQLINYNRLIDGLYYVKEIDEMVEDGYVSHTLKDLQKLDIDINTFTKNDIIYKEGRQKPSEMSAYLQQFKEMK